MKSMTAFASHSVSNDSFVLTMEVKSYNSRYLEFSYSAPPVLASFETKVCNALRNVAQRGHMDIVLRLKKRETELDLSLDSGAAKAYVSSYSKLYELAGGKGRLKADSSLIAALALCPGVLCDRNVESPDLYVSAVDECIACVCKDLEAEKTREGLAMKEDLAAKLAGIAKSVDFVRSNADSLEELIKTGLTEKLNDMLKESSYDENRILTEVAVMLMRYTVNEEVVRLETHIKAFEDLLSQDCAVGKKLDFLCQEMNREINTIGSKSQIVAINLEVVNMKDCLENIREQLRNVE